MGKYTFGILLCVTISGWCLRPPLLILLASIHISPIPFSSMDQSNAWLDKLRMIRYDDSYQDWMLSTSEGIYSLKNLRAAPVKMKDTPPVSVMGLNVWKREKAGDWLIGSFSGMYRWNRTTGWSTDYFTGERVTDVSGAPFGKFAVSGYSDDLKQRPIVVEYHQGTDEIVMPDTYTFLPISLWHLALEIHTGRIYTFLGTGSLVYIFFLGLAVGWCLYSGYVIRRK